MGKAGWDKALTKNCLANFGNDGGQLLLSTAGFEMGAPLVCSGKAGRAPSGTHWDPEIDSDTWATAKTALEIREFKVSFCSSLPSCLRLRSCFRLIGLS